MNPELIQRDWLLTNSIRAVCQTNRPISRCLGKYFSEHSVNVQREYAVHTLHRFERPVHTRLKLGSLELRKCRSRARAVSRYRRLPFARTLRELHAANCRRITTIFIGGHIQCL